MSERQRPASVPEGACWNEAEDEWQWGEVAGGKPVGTWKFFRPDGGLRCIVEHNLLGQRDGEFTRFHPDGSPSLRTRFSAGKENGMRISTRTKSPTDEPHPATGKVWRTEANFVEGVRREVRHFLEDGQPCNIHGVPLSQAYRDEIFTRGEARDFVPAAFESFLQNAAIQGKEAGAQTARDFEEICGKPLPEQLGEALRLLARSGWPQLHQWHTAPLGSFAATGDNLFEDLVHADQHDPAGIRLVDAFSGTFFLGRAPHGGTYHAGLHEEPAPVQVYFLDSAMGKLSNPVARDVGSFCYLTALGSAYRMHETISREGFLASFRKLKGQVSLPVQFQTDLKEADLRDPGFEYEALSAPARQRFQRSAWIRRLLRNDGASTALDVIDPSPAKMYPPPIGRSEDVLPNLPDALGLLFGAFFLRREEQLLAAIRACRKSPARMVRDAVRLMQQLHDGRRSLGAIGDIQALREEFLARLPVRV